MSNGTQLLKPRKSVVVALLVLTVLALGFANAAPTTAKTHLVTTVHSQNVQATFTSVTQPCNGVIDNITTFTENLSGRDAGSTFLRVDTIAPVYPVLFENVSASRFGSFMCNTPFLTVLSKSLAYSYEGSLVSRIFSPGNYTLWIGELQGNGYYTTPFSSTIRIFETWTSTIIT
jgi:hypothetical protein